MEKQTGKNVVTACSSCNVQKGGRLLEKSGMRFSINHLHQQQKIFIKMVKFSSKFFLHESWMDYLYWDVELEN